jgi:ABC-2 type transport system permease protein
VRTVQPQAVAQSVARPLGGLALCRLALRVTALNLKARLEYRVDFLLWLLHGVAYQVMGLAFVWVVLMRFHAIGGWSLGEVLFLYSLRLLTHGLYLPVFWNIMSVSDLVRQGGFDRLLLRPLNPLLQILLQTVQANFAGDLTVALALFAYAQHILHLRWTVAAVAFLVLVLVGGVLLEAAIQLAFSTLSFWVVDSSTVSWWADELMNTFANYPLDLFAAPVRYLFTFVVPVAFLAYFPGAVFLGRADGVVFTPLFAYGAPAAGVLAFTLAYAFWNAGLRRYQGTGT